MNETKRCSKCGEVKALSEFYNHTKGGRTYPRSDCKLCTNKMNRQNSHSFVKQNTDERIAEIEKQNITKVCVRCKQEKPITDFHVHRSQKDGHSGYCHNCYSILRKIEHHGHKDLPFEEYLAWREEQNKIRKGEKYRLKLDVFAHYCPDGIIKCANPYHLHSDDMMRDIDVLSLDHINGEGYKEKDETGRRPAGTSFYRTLKQQGYPTGFQVLCMSCQAKKKVVKREWGDYAKHRWDRLNELIKNRQLTK